MAVLALASEGVALADPELPPLPPPTASPPPTTRLTVELSPTSGPPGTTLSVVAKNGETFQNSSGWEISLHYENDPSSRIMPVLTWPATRVSATVLRFVLPDNVGCGPYRVQVTLPRAAIPSLPPPPPVAWGLAGTYQVTQPCTPVPSITALSTDRAGPGQIVIVTGSGFVAGARVRLFKVGPPPISQIQYLTPTVAGPNQLSFVMPGDDSADRYCGTTRIGVLNPGVPTGSSQLPLNFTCPPNTLHVVTYNVKLLPPQVVLGDCWLFCYDQDIRAPGIANRGDLCGHDVLILQEAFSDSHRNTVVEGLQNCYPYRTQVLGSDGGFADVIQDGGVIILSRWPIANGTGQEVLFGDLCNGTVGDDWDCWADKGVLYAQIIKEGQPYHVFGTHLDSGGDQDDAYARRQEIDVLADFINRQGIDPGEAVLIAGDFNIDPRSHQEFDYLTRTLSVSNLNLDLHATHTNTEVFDYVFYRETNLTPETATITVLPHRDLSDHFPVVGHFLFAREGANPPLPPPVEPRFRVYLPLLASPR